MKNQSTRWALALDAIAVLLLAAPGCGGGGGTTTTSTGQGGGGGSPTDHGAEAAAFTNGGGTAQSQKYRVVFSLGQSTPTQGRISSTHYRAQGGVIGAAGSYQ